MNLANSALRALVGLAYGAAPLLCLYLVALSSGCVFIDDFDKFKVESADASADGAARDAGPADAAKGDSGDAQSPVDGGSDAQMPPDASPACKNVDCTALDSACLQGECRAGKCVAVPAHDGMACGDQACAVCKDGACGVPTDCSALDGPCAHGTCNAASGKCEATPMPEGQSCFDDNPCTFGEHCQAGTCVGQALDCSAYDDECSQGMCDPVAGGCSYGPNHMSQPCDDANPCTLNDRCTSDGICASDSNAAPGSACTDYNSCSGISGMPDGCDGSGNCTPGGAVPGGTACDDDNECTSNDACDGDGSCSGAATREGQACNTGCSSNTTCQDGSCLPSSGTVPAYDTKCFLQWCGRASLCNTDWQNDRVCDCGCPFSDPDCTDCSARMCESDRGRKHRATSWCNQDGKPIDNCPDSLKGDGKCDCGCQFVDPDCSGGSCCGATGKGGCDNSFVENCVCRHESNPEPSCCTDEWTQHCADVAVALGCMVCP
jgi:hypothetical protein